MNRANLPWETGGIDGEVVRGERGCDTIITIAWLEESGDVPCRAGVERGRARLLLAHCSLLAAVELFPFDPLSL